MDKIRKRISSIIDGALGNALYEVIKILFIPFLTALIAQLKQIDFMQILNPTLGFVGYFSISLVVWLAILGVWRIAKQAITRKPHKQQSDLTSQFFQADLTSQSFNVEDALRQLPRRGIATDYKRGLIKQIVNSNATQLQREQAAVHSWNIWLAEESRANSNMFGGLTERQKILDDARTDLEMAIRLDPINEDYQKKWNDYYSDYPMPK